MLSPQSEEFLQLFATFEYCDELSATCQIMKDRYLFFADAISQGCHAKQFIPRLMAEFEQGSELKSQPVAPLMSQRFGIQNMQPGIWAESGHNSWSLFSFFLLLYEPLSFLLRPLYTEIALWQVVNIKATGQGWHFFILSQTRMRQSHFDNIPTIVTPDATDFEVRH